MTAEPTHEHHGTLQKQLHLGSLILFGLAYMTPIIVLGIFGVIAELSDGGSAGAYLIATVAMLFTALSYGLMARHFPVAGSAYTYVRKALELPLAVYFDLIMPKRRIMEIYLNIAEWGPGIYGVEAAAQHHFGISASKLSRRQAALLAVTLPNPAARNPGKPGRGLRQLASIIERRAARAGGYVGCLE